MSETLIKCPQCSAEFPLTASLAAPLVESTRREFENKLVQKDTEISKREAALAKERETLSETLAAKIKTARETIAADEAKKARLAIGGDLEQKAKELTELQSVLKDRDAKLAEAQNAQAELIRKQRELDDAKREMELTIEKRIQDSLGAVREKAKKDTEDELKLKVTEKEQTILAMQKTIEELKRKSEQGSQQLQGEVLEVELESLLRAKFPTDAIEPVPKGEFGGDVLHRIIGPLGQPCGTILWESKRTRNWSDTWLAKLRGDQRIAKAETALIISEVLPKGVESFDLVDGVWVAEPRCAIPIAIVLRQSLIELAMVRKAGEGQETKMELVYKYLNGPRFKQRIEAIVEKFTDMHEDLQREKKTTTKLWARREQQIQGVLEATAGMYGDLQGIAGRTFQEIEGLETKLLEDNSETDNQGAASRDLPI